MKTGLVKWLNDRKGYGFIKPVDGDLTSMFTSTRSGAPGGWSSRRGRRSVSISLRMSARARLSPRTSLPPQTPPERQCLSAERRRSRCWLP